MGVLKANTKTRGPYGQNTIFNVLKLKSDRLKVAVSVFRTINKTIKNVG